MKTAVKIGTGVAVGLGIIAAGLALFTRHTDRRVRATLPPLGRFIALPSGERLHVRELGRPEAPALLLVHGLGGQMGTYTFGIAERLATDFRLVVVDRPGSGYSTRPATTPADLRTQAAALAALIQQLHLSQPLVVGHSLGGAVALTLALEYPALVGGLALVAPLVHLPAAVPAAFRALNIATPWLRTLFAHTLAVPGSMANRQQVMSQIFGPEAVPKGYALKAGGLMGLLPSHFLATSADLQALNAHLPGISARYGELRVPLWILVGTDDRVLPWQEHGQALVALLPDTVLQQVLGGGHMLPVTQPDLTAEFIRAAAGIIGLAAPAK